MAINIGNRREPLWDYFLVDKDKTTAELSVNKPRCEGTVYLLDAPWEGGEGFSPTVIRNGDKYSMYYGTRKKPAFIKEYGHLDERHSLVCNIESYDGLYWKRPTVDKFDYHGITHNNIVLMHESEPRENLAVFIDENPSCPDAERYKGIVRASDGAKSYSEGGSLAYYFSANGYHFERGEDLISEPGKFDSLNIAFYDVLDGEYKLFHRDFQNEKRAVRHRTSKDFKSWTDQGFIEFSDGESFELYTSNIRRYERAPHVYIGLPVRYTERKEWTKNYDQLNDRELRQSYMHNKGYERLGLAMTDTLFMTSRDGLHWDRFNEAFLDSGVERHGKWFYGGNHLSNGYATVGEKMYFYEIVRMQEADKPAELVAHSIRIDGFASFKAPYSGARLTTKPFIFDGDKLSINFRTSAAGSVYVTITDESGNTAKSIELFGNNIDATVPFNKSLADLSGKKVTLSFEMKDAELYSFKFN